MILTIDIGNTNIKFGFTHENTIVSTFNMATDSGKTSDEYWLFLGIIASKANIDLNNIKGVAICSVVPTLDPVFLSMCKRYFDINPLFVEPGIKTGVTISTDNPREVGADIVTISAGAIVFYKTPCIVISYGTATAFVGISKDKELLGVAIAPGLITSAEALFKKTSKLPRVDLKDPHTYLGKNSSLSLQAGFYYGFQGLSRNIIFGMKNEMKEENIQVIATGGYSSLMKLCVKEIDFVDPYLSLKGLSVIYDKNLANR
jgi:type III pantothenate kinase